MRIRRVLAVVPLAASLLLPSHIASPAAASPVATEGATARAATTPVRTTTAWRDDFNTIDTRNWRVVDGWGCKAASNVSTSAGLLRLKTVATSDPNCPLLGGRVDTYNLRTFAPGTYTSRIKFAAKKGSWQSFWLTGDSGRTFPSNGEVDIAEVLGREPNASHMRLHSSRRDGGAARCTQKADLIKTASYIAGWHTWSVTTSSKKVVFKVDGTVIASFVPNSTCAWPFTDPMRVIMNVGGGTWAGTPNKSLFPVTVLVDWFAYKPL